jgi:hypothetical protein
VFDRVVAIDAGVDELFSYGSVESGDVTPLVHGAIFTRKVSDLSSTAIFVGGQNVARAEEILATVKRSFFGPMRCSVMLDANGANTTAAAAVLAARKHLDLPHTKALVLGATGPVGQRVALLLAREKAAVWLGSRTKERAEDACNEIKARHADAKCFPVAVSDHDSISQHPERFNLVVAATAAGVRVVEKDHLAGHSNLKMLIDLNAVPPTGIEGVEATDCGREANGIIHYGAIGVGGAKMKIHRAAIAALFEANHRVLDAEEIYELGLGLQK